MPERGTRYAHPMPERIMYVQLKTGHPLDAGPAWISRVRFTKTWKNGVLPRPHPRPRAVVGRQLPRRRHRRVLLALRPEARPHRRPVRPRRPHRRRRRPRRLRGVPRRRHPLPRPRRRLTSRHTRGRAATALTAPPTGREAPRTPPRSSRPSRPVLRAYTPSPTRAAPAPPPHPRPAAARTPPGSPARSATHSGTRPQPLPAPRCPVHDHPPPRLPQPRPLEVLRRGHLRHGGARRRRSS